MTSSSSTTKITCSHCGDECTRSIWYAEKPFCCEGCQAVYQLLEDNGLCTYYDLEKNPGFTIKARKKEEFAYLDNQEIVHQLLDFDEGNTAKIRLSVPRIHCSSCIWLLENLFQIERGVISSRVNFQLKEIQLMYRKDETNLRRLVEVMDSLGYPPEIRLESYTKTKSSKKDHSLSYKIGITAFCASNIMMFSFPEYFGLDGWGEARLHQAFLYLNLLFSLPVVLYGGSDYFVSAWKGLKNKTLNLDVPIVLGTLAVFLRSVYEVIAHVGPGYFDSLTGLLFFLLIGKWIQNRTYQRFSFERDYQSFLPVAVTKLENDEELTVPIQSLKKGDVILVRNQEIVPADSILEGQSANIDNSFVTGESEPVSKSRNDLIYAGGRVTGPSIRLIVQKEVQNSYLLQLWNQQVFHKTSDAYLSSFVLLFSKYFVAGTLIITLFTGLFWYWADPSKLLFAVTSVLLVACPCALALSLPFALSNCLRLLSQKGLFLKNADVVEKLAEVDTIVFDKTGTLTKAEIIRLVHIDSRCSERELSAIRSVAGQSTHPLSKAIYSFLQAPLLPVSHFEEQLGKGIVAQVENMKVRIGSCTFLDLSAEDTSSSVFVEVDGKAMGHLVVQPTYREGYQTLLTRLSRQYDLHLLSGDNDWEKHHLQQFFAEEKMLFRQQPTDKLNYIQSLQKKGKKVMMVGDGLNDAGALKAAEVGITVADDVYHFIPACDGILESKALTKLSTFLLYSKSGIRVIQLSLALSLVYNFIGLYFATSGQLSPLVAAILMPLSSVTVVAFVVLATSMKATKILKPLPVANNIRTLPKPSL